MIKFTDNNYVIKEFLPLNVIYISTDVSKIFLLPKILESEVFRTTYLQLFYEILKHNCYNKV